MSIVVEFTNCEETLCYDVIDRFCFSKQKSAYDRRIRDWSSDVCSSDLEPLQHPGPRLPRAMSGSVRLRLLAVGFELLQDTLHLVLGQQDRSDECPVGKESVSRCRSRWAPSHYKKNRLTLSAILYHTLSKRCQPYYEKSVINITTQ